MVFANKRGVSPLIATILLISFAVSLGAVIMNLGANLSETVCDDVSIKPLSIAQTQRVCVDGSTLRFGIVNEGATIEGVRVTLVGESIEEDDFLESTQSLATFGDSIDFTQEFIDAVIFTPIIYDGSELAYCPNQKREIITITQC